MSSQRALATPGACRYPVAGRGPTGPTATEGGSTLNTAVIACGLRRAALVTGLLLPAACTTVVPDVRTRTPIYEALIPAAPEAAAGCIGPILDEVFAPVSHEVRTFPDRAAAEVVGSSTLGTAVVISLSRSGEQTRIAVRRSPLVTLTHDDSEYAKAIASCATAK